MGDTIFAGETGLNLTPLTPYANGTVQVLRKYQNDNPDLGVLDSIIVPDSNKYDVGSVNYYGTYFPVVNNQVLKAYPLQIQPTIPGYPQNVAVTSSKEWVIADGSDSALITITVTDGGNNPVSEADLALSVSSPWRLQSSVLKTDNFGRAQTLFLPTPKSGAAVIAVSASVQGVTSTPVTTTLLQNIDAGTPYVAKPVYPSTATVGFPARISVQVADRFGNPVTSRRAETDVGFLTTTSGTGAFLDGSGDRLKAITVPLNDSGWAAVTFLVSTKQGDNFVSIIPPSPLSLSLIDIVGTGDSPPFSIAQTVDPAGNPPFVLADGSSQVAFVYYLYDQWGNPAADQGIQVTTNVGENGTFFTNDEGRAAVVYGPKLSAGFYTITASAVENSTVRISQTVRFGSTGPKDMLLTASPQTMASRDVKEEGVSSVMAKVIDAMGNPVQGETVLFSIQSVNNGTFIQTMEPLLGNAVSRTDTIGAVTDENGYATVNFHPGAFLIDKTNPKYSATAEGTAKIQATWSGVTRALDISYKNYPYLSVYTFANPMTVESGKEVEISIRLKGDGYALQPKPIDVMLVTDRSGTMLWDYPDRELLVMSAAKTFASKFDYSRDRIGQISFGGKGKATVEDYPSNSGDCGVDKNRADDLNYANNYKGNGTTYADYANLDLPLSSSISVINSAIERVVPDGNTPMRYALYKAITEMKNNGNPKSVKAVVLLTDGDYNEWGDPLARGSTGSTTPTSYSTLTTKYYPFTDISTQNMAQYASVNNIRIYTIAYGSALSTGGIETLQLLASGANGTYNHAMNEADLNSFYTQIRGALIDTAGVNTKMDLNFQNVEVNGVSYTGPDVVQYEYIDGKSTELIPPAPGTKYTIDSTDDWNLDHKLDFNLGTIKINQEWVVNFTLKVLQPGNIKILGSTSQILFDDGKGTLGTLTIPDTYITAVPPLDRGLMTPTLMIKNLRRTNDGSDTAIASLAWDIVYTNGRYDKIKEVIEVRPLNWEAYAYVDTISAKNTDTTGTYNMDISKLQPGTYIVKVTGSTDDPAGPSSDTTQFTIPVSAARTEIVIH